MKQKIKTENSNLRQQLAGCLTPKLVHISITEVSTLRSLKVLGNDGLGV